MLETYTILIINDLLSEFGIIIEDVHDKSAFIEKLWADYSKSSSELYGDLLSYMSDNIENLKESAK